MASIYKQFVTGMVNSYGLLWGPLLVYMTLLLSNQRAYFDLEEYVLADKAYGLERHIITPIRNLHPGSL